MVKTEKDCQAVYKLVLQFMVYLLYTKSKADVFGVF